MNQRLAAALIGTTMGLATFAGSTIAVSVAAPEEEPRLSQDQVSKVICRVLEDLDLLDHPELKDLVKELGCKKSGKPTKTTTKTKTT
ncbi:hypothetical protein [Saccharothrix sp. NRRL B-16314]|uniref:hypothetical protein n=1 Tax=Saccharothrix sp. NRRL B-16314 TaxID=1463825 RepID=UPI000525B798|nr:hypothetical protein [Saccharothrix sp. NRRL B-16314]